MPNPNAIPLPPTTDELEWLKQRRTGIGSSDASAVIGMSTRRAPYSVWLDKTGQSPLREAFDDNTEEMFFWGHRLEPIIREVTAERLGITIDKPDNAYKMHGAEYRHANLDGWAPDDGIPAEFKNADARTAHLWDGQVPDHAEIQMHHGAAVAGCKPGDPFIISGLVGGNRLAIYEGTLNGTVMDILAETEATFWEHVETRTPPPEDGHSLNYKAIRDAWTHRTGPAIVDMVDMTETWRQWADADRRLRQATIDKDTALATIARHMDGHPTLMSGDHLWARAQRGQLSTRRLQADHPDIWEKYQRPVVTFDLQAFKQDHPTLYAQYQGISIRPTTTPPEQDNNHG